jgi:hypothetical protein
VNAASPRGVGLTVAFQRVLEYSCRGRTNNLATGVPAIAVDKFVVFLLHGFARVKLHRHGGIVQQEDIDCLERVGGDELAAAVLLMLAT